MGARMELTNQKCDGNQEMVSLLSPQHTYYETVLKLIDDEVPPIRNAEGGDR
jgi:hypothetical protein